MGYWQTLNELEKKKEAILAAHKERGDVDQNEVEEPEVDDDDDDDFEDNWRSRKII